MSIPPPAGPVTRLTRNGHRRWAQSGWVVIVCLLIAVPAAILAQLPSTPTTPGIALEIPGTADGALGILRNYEDHRTQDNSNPHDLDRARTAILWDFLFILSYSIGLATLLEWLATRDPDRADALIGYAAWGALLAGACDVVENLSMLTLISKYQHNPEANLGLPALLGTLASLTKWTLVLAVLGYTIREVAKRLVNFFRRKPLS